MFTIISAENEPGKGEGNKEQHEEFFVVKIGTKLILDNNKYFQSFFLMWAILAFTRFFTGNLRAYEKEHRDHRDLQSKRNTVN